MASSALFDWETGLQFIPLGHSGRLYAGMAFFRFPHNVI